MTIEETVKWFNDQMMRVREQEETKRAFICGITSDMESFRQTHTDITVICYTKCNSVSTAQSLVKQLEEDGFEFETKSVDEERLYVYMYRKAGKFS